MNNSELYIYSVKVSALRWIQPHIAFASRFVPTHTFASIGDDWVFPPSEDEDRAYWYCAGDFCASNEPGVLKQELGEVDVAYARCLVRPNLKYSADCPIHQEEVISGRYMVDFVCHNITNRVMAAYRGSPTLGDLLGLGSLDLTGYKMVVLSPLGLYGRNEVDWGSRLARCEPPDTEETGMSTRPTRQMEVKKIHTVASNGDAGDALTLTKMLAPVDDVYRKKTEALFAAYDAGEITDAQFHEQMFDAMLELLLLTECIVGAEQSRSIHGVTFLEHARESGLRDEEITALRCSILSRSHSFDVMTT